MAEDCSTSGKEQHLPSPKTHRPCTEVSSGSLFPAAPTSQATTVGMRPEPTEKSHPAEKSVSIFQDASTMQPARWENTGTPKLKKTVPVLHSLKLRYILYIFMYVYKIDR